VATISGNNDPEIGELIASAIENVGREGVETLEEYLLEMICDEKLIKPVIHALKKSHPYEEPAFTIVRLENFYEEIKPHA
jgi:hypothetical protein